MSMLRRQVAIEGGCGEMGYGDVGGIFSSKARTGAAEYQAFRKMHPGLPREQLSAMWHQHKMGGAMVGGFPGQRAAFKAIKGMNPRSSKKGLHTLYQAARDTYSAEHPEYRPKKRSGIRRTPVPAGLRPLYKEAVALSKMNPDCPPFVGTRRDNKDGTLSQLVHRLQRMEMKHGPEVVAEVVAQAVPASAAAIPEPEALEEILSELYGSALAGGRRRRR